MSPAFLNNSRNSGLAKCLFACVLLYLSAAAYGSAPDNPGDSLEAGGRGTGNAVVSNATTSGSSSETGGLLRSRPAYAGVWVNTFGREYDLTPYSDFIAGEADRLRWDKLEPSEGAYDFSSLEKTLARIMQREYYYYAEVWTGSHVPDWLYAVGVPRVAITGGSPSPYYLNPLYREKVKAFFNALAAFFAQLPAEQRERVAFLQPGFGSTGDRQLYKGKPRESRYEIDSSEYLAFMKEMTNAWRAAFASRPETADFLFFYFTCSPKHRPFLLSKNRGIAAARCISDGLRREPE